VVHNRIYGGRCDDKKIVSSAQDKRLTIRFYNDVDLPLPPVEPKPKVGDEMRKPKTKRPKDKK
jgi:hypothetical protein